MKVLSTSRSSYREFRLEPEETVGTAIYPVGDRQLDIPELRRLLETVFPRDQVFDDFALEIELSAWVETGSP